MVGITSYGCYVPKFRIASNELKNVWNKSISGITEKSVPYSDEDTITMAVNAAKNMLTPDINIDLIKSLYVATVSSPFIEKQASTLLNSILGLDEFSKNIDLTGSARAGGYALESAVNDVLLNEGSTSLVLTTDALIAKPGTNSEGAFGAGATAWLIGKDNFIATIEGFSSHSSEISERWRTVKGDYQEGDARFVRQHGITKTMKGAISQLLKKLNRSVNDYDHVIIQQSDGRLPLQVAKVMKLDRGKLESGNIVKYFGDLGVSSVFMGLASVLDVAEPDQTILCAIWGSGGTHAFSLKTTTELNKRRSKPSVEYFVKEKELIDYPTYLKYLGFI